MSYLAKHGRPYATGEKAFNHLKMKHSQDNDEFFSKIQGQKDHGEHTKSKLAKLLTAHGTSWISG